MITIKVNKNAMVPVSEKDWPADRKNLGFIIIPNQPMLVRAACILPGNKESASVEVQCVVLKAPDALKL